MHRTSSRVIALGFAVALLATACSKSSPTATGSTTSSPPSTAGSPSSSGGGTIAIGDDNANDHGTKDITGLSTVNVEQHNGSDYYFDPTVLAGAAGQTITVHVENKGTLPHTFTIDSLNVDVELQPGDEKDVPVTLPTTGVVEFYCQFHHSLGMAGELKVA